MRLGHSLQHVGSGELVGRCEKGEDLAREVAKKKGRLRQMRNLEGDESCKEDWRA